METQTSIGDRLKAVRLGAGLGQDVFAASLGYSKRSLIAWETDAASVPLKVVAMLRSLYDIDPEWIIMGADTVPASHFGPPDWNRYDRLVDMVSAVLTDMNVELAPEARQRIARTLYDTGAAAHDAVRAQLRGIISALAINAG